MSAKAKIIEIRKRLAEMSPEQRAEMIARAGSIVTVEGRALSSRNTELIANQMDGVTIVGGFQQWKRAGRMVRKGEKGLAIWVPAMQKGKEGEDPNPEDDMYFFGASVFDITQTEPLEMEG